MLASNPNSKGRERLGLPSTVVLSDPRNTLEIFITEFDLFKVGDDAVFLDTLGNDRLATTGTPRDEDLSWGGVEPSSNIFDNLMFCEFRLANH